MGLKLSKVVFSVIAVAALCLMCGVAQADAVIFSDNFNSLTPQLSATSVGLFTTIDGTNVDIVGGSLFGNLCAAPESGNCIDLDGTGGNPQGVLQSVAITLNPGTYYLSFDLIGSQRGVTTSTTVTFGSLYDNTFMLASSDDTDGIVKNAPITVASTTTLNLVFTSNTPGDIGAVLDNVLITSPIPEPASLFLLGTGLLACGMLTRRFMHA